MIARKHRFHGHGSLGYLMKHGKTVRVESMALRYCPGKNDAYRLSVVVSKKVSKSAVVRNRIRRRIFEAVRLNIKQRGAYPSLDMSISVFDDTLTTRPWSELEKQIDYLLGKASG